jgi:single-strand DNA-binding protein
MWLAKRAQSDVEFDMFDTYVTVVGNVLTAPEWKRTTQTNTLVATFKVASTARRLDRETGGWVDGNSLRVRVTCWRKLAEGVAASLMTGDPVIVFGRLYTRDWTDADGNHRTMYELEAAAVGHDLSRGRGTFTRNRANLSTSETDAPGGEERARGEVVEPVSGAELPEVAGAEAESVSDSAPGDEPPEPAESQNDASASAPSVTSVPSVDDELDDVLATAGRGRRKARTPVPV